MTFKLSDMLDLEYLGHTAFDAYGEFADWKTYDNRPMPQWEEVGEEVQNRWKASAQAIVNTLSLL